MAGNGSDGGRLLSFASATLAGVLAMKALRSVWRSSTGDEPPLNPADPSTRWRDAITWGAAAGAVVGVARILGRRGAAAVYAEATGESAAAMEDA